MRMLILVVSLVLPVSASAKVVFTEIMYSPPGVDSGFEWVEIRNEGSEDVDLSGWKFFEEGVNHRLVPVVGSGTIKAGSYALIADKAENFINGWASSGAEVFDSSFSLKNSGEILSLKDGEGNIIESVSYTGGQGGDGDGSSLHIQNGLWVPAVPSPGSGAVVIVPKTESSPPKNIEESDGVVTVVSTENVEPEDGFPVETAVDQSATVLLSSEGNSIKDTLKWGGLLFAVAAVSFLAYFALRTKDDVYRIISEGDELD